MRDLIVLALASVVSGGTLHAQVLGDTAVYHEVTDSRTILEMPQGEVASDSKHDATIAFWQISTDSALAWYESVTVSINSPMQSAAPDLSSLTRQPFTLAIAPNGKVQVRRAPEFPATLRGISDLSLQFFDFFLVKPGSTMRVGLQWTDTLAMSTDSAGVVGSTQKITAYHVEKDTVFAGEAALIVAGTGEVTMATRQPVDGQPGMVMNIRYTGPETNRFIVSKTSGALILRKRTAAFSGEISFSGGPDDFSMPMKQTYSSQIALVAESRQ